MLKINNYNLLSNERVSNPSWQLSDFLFCLEFVFNNKFQFVDNFKKVSKNKFSINIFFVFAKWFKDNIALVKNINGPKFIIEHDAYMNFIPGHPYFGFWTELYKEINFDLLICSGKEIANKLNSIGIPSVWIPKGVSKYMFNFKNENTGQIGIFLAPFGEERTNNNFQLIKDINLSEPPLHYISRYKMIENLKQNFPNMLGIQTLYRSFPNIISKFSGICMNDAEACEPMSKHFECSALGCIPFRDKIDELYDLGYNNNSMVVYNDLNHLIDLVKFYNNHPFKLKKIQEKAKEVTFNHTWEIRALKVKEVVDAYILNKQI